MGPAIAVRSNTQRYEDLEDTKNALNNLLYSDFPGLCWE